MKMFFRFACLSLLISQAFAAPNDLDQAWVSPLTAGAGVIGIATQADGKLILSGGWGSIGVGGHSRIARLDPVTGEVDESYSTSISGSIPRALRFQPDGKLVVAGAFTAVNGTARGRVARLNADGTLDTSFADPQVTGGAEVYAVAIQADGKILIGGSFTAVAGVTRNNLARLNADGTLDTSFDPAPNSIVQSIALLPGGKIVLGGYFYQLAGSANFARYGLAVLNSDGTLENVSIPFVAGVACVAVQPDGGILVGGQFDQNGGIFFNGLMRIKPDRTRDTNFIPDFGTLPDTNPGKVESLAIQADGKIVVGGTFFTTGGVTRNYASRINADGTLDTGFDPNFNDIVKAVALQTDGKVVIGGYFTTAGSTMRNNLVRYDNTLPTEQLSVPSTARIQWLRGGSAPEAERVVFEQSTDSGASWTTLGDGTRITGGWELTGLSLPASVRIRASALTMGGFGNGSSGLMQSEDDFPLVPPVIVVEQPQNTALTSGSSTVDFGNAVSGIASSPLSFTLRNTGSGALKRLQFSIDGVNAHEFALTPPASTTLAAGGTTTFSIVFTPGAQSARSATLRIGSSDPTTPVYTVGLSGTGVPSPNANLAGIELPSPTVLSPTFASGTLSYTASVVFGIPSIRITPTAAQSAATIRVNGTITASGTASAPINLTTGPNNITVVVTAENGVNTRTYTLVVTRAAAPAPGELDFSFNPYASHEVHTLALQSDGKLILGGIFPYLGAPVNTAGNIDRFGIGRLAPDLSFDAYNPFYPGTACYALSLLSNGQLLVGGTFATGTAAPPVNGVALVNADGTLVSSYDPVCNGMISQMVQVSGGDLVIVGAFTTVDGTTRNLIARLNSNGTLDTAFNPNVTGGGAVRSVSVQSDGKLIIGGQFTQVGSTARKNVARLTAAGAVDTTFTSPAAVDDGDVYVVQVLPDGKVMVGGVFSEGDGLVRLNSDGTLDPSYQLGTGTGVRQITSLAVQENGKLLVAGYGTSGHTAIERQNADGTLDTSFQASVSGSAEVVRSILIQADGRIVVGGNFTSVNGIARSNVARLDGATPQTLAPVSGSLVEWNRGGLPPATSVAFDLSTDNGNTWSVVDASGTFVNGVWQGTIGTALPTSGGLLRGRAIIADGQHGELSFQTTFSPAAADIIVEQPTGNERDDGDTIALGNLGLNVLNPMVFTVRNGGGQALTGITASIIGTNANQFTLIDAPDASVASLESTTLTVQAKVTTVGAKTATLRIVSNDPDESPFEIILTATGVAAVLPTATTNPATAISFSTGTAPNIVTATLNGTVDAKGQPRDISFDLGLSTAYGTNVVATPATLNTTGATAVTAVLTDLAPHTTYHFRVRADGALGDALGANRTFLTPNHLPVATNDTAINLPSAAVTMDVLQNDVDDDGDSLTITAKTAVTPSTAGTVAIVANELVFTASAAFGTAPNASATFGYTVSDGFGGTDIGSVAVTAGTASIDVPSVSVPSAGVTYLVQLTTVGSWAVTEALTWASVSPTRGIGNATVQVTLLPNTAIAARSGSIKIGGVPHGITQAGVLAPLVSAPVRTGTSDGAPFNTVVGERGVSITIPCTNFPVTFSVASGTLPPGLTLNTATGVISGIPTAGGTVAAPTKAYPLTIKATNAKGNSTTPSFTINVDAMPTAIIGTWHGLIEPHATAHIVTTPWLGARLELTTQSNGTSTATFYEGTTKKSVTGTLAATVPTKQTPTLTVAVPGTAYTLDLTLSATTNTVTGSLSDSPGNSASIQGWRNAWTTVAPANKATRYLGRQNLYLRNTSTSDGPQGDGYASFIVTETTGAFSLTGKLADETKTTATVITTSFIGQQGQVLFYLPLYGGRGACAGVMVLDPTITGANQIQGSLSWYKPAPLATSTDTVYKSGFGPVTVSAQGNVYVAPGKGLRVMNAAAGAANNATLAFADGGLASTFTQALNIKNPSATGLTNVATVPPYNLGTSTNLNKVTLPTLTAPTGLFSGSFTIAGTPARVAPFYGQIVRDVTATTDTVQGYGYFLLPSVPVSPQTVATSPKLSGGVLFTAP